MDISYITDLITDKCPFGFLVIELKDKPYVTAVVAPEFFMAAFIDSHKISTLSEYQQQLIATYLWQYYLRNKKATQRGNIKYLCKLKSWPATMLENPFLADILPLLVKPRVFMTALCTIAKKGVSWYHGDSGQTYVKCMRHALALVKLYPGDRSVIGKLMGYILKLELEGHDTSYVTDDLVGILGF